MATITSDARFLGMDLRAAWQQVRQAWSAVHDAPPLSWMQPLARVRLLHADGGESMWWGDSRRAPAGEAAGEGAFVAVELPDDLVLRRVWNLPAMSDADIANAVILQARSISPFAEADLAWGYRAQRQSAGGVTVDLVIASRRQITQHLQARSDRLGAHADPEVWVVPADAPPIVMQGYGVALRRMHAARGRRVRYILLGTAGLLLAAMALTPTLQLRFRALQAYAEHQAVAARTAPLVKERETLMQSAESLTALADILAGRIEPLRLLDRLTKVLPDDTALQTLSLKEQKVTITGLTSNASALMQLLSEQAGMHDVRAPSAATRAGGTDPKENFVIEFVVEPQAFGVAVGPVASGESSSSPAAPTASRGRP